MSDKTALDSGYLHLKAATRFKQWANGNPADAARLDTYVAQRSAGQNPPIPTMTTELGMGLAQWASMAQVAAPEPPPPPPATTTLLGVYKGAGKDAYVTSFQNWLGKPVDLVTDWCAGTSWSTIETPWLDNWQGKGWRLHLGVPPWPDNSGSTLAQAAGGAFDSHYTALAANLVKWGFGDAILRPAWEFGGNWYTWHPKTSTEAADYAAFFRRFVVACRTQGLKFEFCWNPITTLTGPDQTLAYPGDGYVDQIGLDLYDAWSTFDAQMVAPQGIKFWTDFAATHGKEMAYPEWGLVDTAHHGYGDDPSFIDKVADLIGAHPTAWHAYFDVTASDGDHLLSHFPNSQAHYKARFG